MCNTEVKKYNSKRSNIISSLKRKCIETSKDVRKYIDEHTLPVDVFSQSVDVSDKLDYLTEEQIKHLLRFDKNINTCSSDTLYKQNLNSGELKILASHTCSNKNCPICNFHNKKRIRRKYFKWFKDNQFINAYQNKKTGKIKYVTNSQNEKFEYNDKFSFLYKNSYDLMHLTLTVPHYAETGFNGEKYYFKQLIKLYWLMRKDSTWLEWVLGGEYGIETTRNANGFHIHIHSLLFVRKGTQNRNKLHKVILELWNKLSVNSDSKRIDFSQSDCEKIKKGNKLIDDKFISKLNPKGSSLITLESVYTEVNGAKSYSKEWNDQSMLKAVMETISYHFEPQALNKEDKTLDISLLAELLPHVYKIKMYEKFGCLRGEKSLNLRDNQTVMIDDAVESSEVKNEDYSVDEDTGEIFIENEYFICNPAFVYHFGEPGDLTICLSKKAREKLIKLKATSTFEAIDEMMGVVISKIKHKNESEGYLKRDHAKYKPDEFVDDFENQLIFNN